MENCQIIPTECGKELYTKQMNTDLGDSEKNGLLNGYVQIMIAE